jgi:5'-phosphate synthase pdxT subunit
VRVGVLALQGDVREHVGALGDLGQSATLVRRPVDLAGLDGIILPGGESTTLSMLLESSGLFEPLGAALTAGLPVFGTCAGLVLLAARVLDGRPDQRTFGVLGCSVRRNGYGRQLASFEATVDVPGLLPPGGVGAASPAASLPAPLPAVFIRAPVVLEVSAEVEVLGSLSRDGVEPARPVICRQGPVLATTFHPELTPDRRLHRLFLHMAGGVAGGVAGAVAGGVTGPTAEAGSGAVEGGR